MKSFKQFFIEARANTKSVRVGLSKRTKTPDPIQQASKQKEQDDDWEKLQQHIASKKKVNEDGEGPTNVVGQGAIAGTGGKGGEPGVSKKRNPVMSFFKRKPPKGM